MICIKVLKVFKFYIRLTKAILVQVQAKLRKQNNSKITKGYEKYFTGQWIYPINIPNIKYQYLSN